MNNKEKKKEIILNLLNVKQSVSAYHEELGEYLSASKGVADRNDQDFTVDDMFTMR
jgi:hypothetical protein